MPLLTIVNLTVSAIAVQDPTGLAFISLTVPGSGTITDKVVTAAQFAAIEPQLVGLAAASEVTYSIRDDPSSQADDVTRSVSTALTSPHVAGVNAQVIVTDLTSAGAVSVVLPVAAAIGHEVTVIDGKGDAAANNVTISATGGTINGGANIVINVNRGFALLVKTAVNVWKAVLSSVISAGAAGGALTGTYPNPTLAFGGRVVSDLSFSVATEAANHIDVTVQLKDANNVNLAVVAEATVWVSDTALAAPTGTVPDGGTAVQTGTQLKVDTAAVLLRALTNASGVVVIRVTESTAKSFFVNVAASGVAKAQSITFA